MTLSNAEVGLLLDGSWVTVSSGSYKVYTRDPISITHGRSDWATSTDPATASFTLDSRSHDWAPDDVRSSFWGSYRRNIPCRIGVGLGDAYLESQGRPNGGGSGAYCNSSAALEITGDIDVRIEFQLSEDPWDRAIVGANVVYSQFNLIEKYGLGGGWRLGMYNLNGFLGIMWDWIDNSDFVWGAESINVGALLPYWARYRRITIRVTFEPSTGTVTYYYGTGGVNGSFILLGSDATGATTLKAGADQVRVSGNYDSYNWRPFPGRTYAAEIRDGIAGTVVASPTFEGVTVGASSVTDAQGNVFNMGSGGRITNMRWRFHGELSSLPIRSDLSGKDIWAPVQASGILRRLRQGQPPLESPLRRAITRTAQNVVAYWPMEEVGSTLTRYAAAKGTQPAVIINGVYPTTGANTDFQASSALPQLGGGVIEARVDTYSGTNWQLRWLMSIPSDLTGTDVPIVQIGTSDMSWQVLWRTDGAMKVQASRAGVAQYDSGWIGFNVTGSPVRANLSVSANGGNVDVDFETQTPGGVSGGVVDTNAVAGSPGQVTLLRWNANGGLGETAIGHVTLQGTVTSTSELATELNAYDGEPAGIRIQRLCSEEGIPVRIEGSTSDTEAMGPQTPATLLDLLQQCADVDLGILGEARDSVGLWYRTRADMLGQTPAVTLDYTGGEVAGVIELDRDDQGFVNDWTLTGPSGETARAELDDGSRISVSEPPTGAGRYALSVDVQATSNRLADLAYTRLRFSAVDEPRVSNLGVGLHMPALAANPTLALSVLEAKSGDLVQVDNVGNYTGSLSQILQGTSETIEAATHEIGLLTTPGSPWGTGLVEDATYPARYDTAGSELASGASSGATSLSVATTLGPIWTTDAGDFPFDIKVDGVRVTVTAISGSSSPQTFTVDATSRALASGSLVELADPTYWEL